MVRKKTKEYSGLSDVEYMEMISRKRQGEKEARDNFENIKKHYPKLKYEDVIVVTQTAVRMRDGSIYRIPMNKMRVV